jgi:glycosyltransferase involved in cell wall biosynthesis/tetratricopeptide (TPR) repeat protein
MTDQFLAPAGREDAAIRSTQPVLGDWLSRRWLVDGPPVCVVEGFSGLGKSHLARHVRDGYGQVSTWIDIADAHTSFEDFLLKAQGRLKADADIGIPIGADLSTEIQRELRSNLLIVIDDFQNCLELDTHEMTGPFADFFGDMRSGRAGRVLALSSRAVDEQQCQELGIAQRTLAPLPPEDGGALLRRLLAARDREDLVPHSRLVELAGWLGSNPRAMQALVGALKYHLLSELVGDEQGPAEIGYRRVEPPMVKELEKRFVQRTMDRLSAEEQMLLKRLAVHRKSFGRRAIALAHTNVDGDPGQTVQDLIDLFFVELHGVEYSLNPTVRELALRSVLGNRRAARTAHRYAADFYLEHFHAKRAKPLALTDKFMEVRHHLHLAGRTDELREIAQTFALHLQRSALSQPIPEDPDELDEQILLLDAALDQGSPSSELNLRLAQMLLQRGRDGDRALALAETTEAIAIPSAPAKVWRLHLELVYRTEGLDAVLPVIDRAQAVLPVKAHASISMEYASLLRRENRLHEALELLTAIIGAGPDSGGNRASCFAQAIALCRRLGDGDQAERLITVARAESPDVSVYQAGIEFHVDRGDFAAAVELVDEAFRRITAEQQLIQLYDVGIKLHWRRNDPGTAKALLAEGIARFTPEPHVQVIYHAGIRLQAASGDTAAALALVDQAIRELPPTPATQRLVSPGILLHVQRGDLDAAMHLGLRGMSVGNDSVLAPIMLCTVLQFLTRPDTAHQAQEWWAVLDRQIGPRYAVLSHVLRLIVAGDWAGAAERAAEDRERVATTILIELEVFAAVAAGRPAAAVRAAEVLGVLKANRLTRDGGRVTAWIIALAHAAAGNAAQAQRVLADSGWDAVPDGDPLSACVQLWLREVEPARLMPSFLYPLLPRQITGLPEDLVHPSVMAAPAEPPVENPTHPVPAAPEALPAKMTDRPRGPAMLMVATEWTSAHGGLSTVNRHLCRAMAALGARVVCLVLTATDDDRRDARESGVELREAPGAPLEPDLLALSSRGCVPEGFEPDYIIGHGRITGPAAHRLAEHFPTAGRLHVIHTAPDEIEWHKLDRSDDAGERSDIRQRAEIELSRTAHCTIAVGPRLYGRFARDLSGSGSTRVVNLVPGFDADVDGSRTPPPGAPWKILVAGRMDDAPVKGLDIAAGAVAAAQRNRTSPQPRLELFVRGAPPGESEPLRRKVLDWAGLPGMDVVVRPYSAEHGSMADDMRTSSLVLMPSRREGFGMIGLEAITAGVPVLVSANSGLGEHLHHEVPELSERMVVPVVDSLGVDVARWSGMITSVLFDREAAFARAAQAQRQLAALNTWERAAAELLRSLTAP